MRLRKRYQLGLSLAAVYLVLSLVAARFLAESALHPGRRSLPPAAVRVMRQTAAQFDSRLEEVEILARDQARLDAWLVENSPSTSHRPDVVILLHGLGDNRLGTVGYARLFLGHGYSVLMPDARAHGTSGGSIATYGLVERSDIRAWYEWIERTRHPECVFALGESMGAAQLLESLDVPFCAVVAESPFSSFLEIAFDRMGQPFRLGPWVGRTVLRPTIELALAYARLKYHLDLRSASPEDGVARSRVPVLLIHGQDDRNIPVRHSRRIASRNPRLVLWQLADTDHCGAIAHAPAEFEQRVVGWFQAHRRPAVQIA